jgi:hypothetical protein
MQDDAQPDLMLVTSDIAKIGILACYAGFTQSAFELFESLHQSFPDVGCPIMGMVCVHLANSKFDEANDTLEKNKKLFFENAAADEFNIMQCLIAYYKQENNKAMSFLLDLKKSHKETSRNFADALMQQMI